jgi:transcriptional regulator with XRE-family HTH domain
MKCFKELIRETSVYKYFVELKEGNFTEQGYFDLEKVPGLYVIGAGQFLKNLRKNKDLRLIDIANSLSFNLYRVSHWENNHKNIPIQSLVKIAEKYGVSRDTIYSLIDQGKFKTKTNLPVKFEKIKDIIKYLSVPPRRRQSVIILRCPPKITKHIKTLGFKIKPWDRSFCINSRKLYDYLLTFFRYIKVPKIVPPLTAEVKFLYDRGDDLKRAIIIPCLQSDGSMQHSQFITKLEFTGNNRCLHDYFVDSMYYEYNQFPTSYFTRNFYTAYYQSAREIGDAIIKIAGNTKTSPANRQTAEDYLKEPQPHLNYLINASKTVKVMALRIWASAEGSISIRREKLGISPVFIISCTHPALTSQLQQIAKQLNINLKLSKSKKKWSGIRGLETHSRKDLLTFLRIGGFIKGIKIGFTSRYHEGINKDVLTLGILEYIRQRRMNKWPKKLPTSNHHYSVNKIVRNREYKAADYYIDYFS